MYSEKYQELERLTKKSKIGKVILITLMIIVFFFPMVVSILSDMLPPQIENYIILVIFVGIALMIVTYLIFYAPLNNLKNEINTMVKQNILKEEVNSIFNSSYKEEDEEQFKNTLQELEIGIHKSKSIDDCFSAKYNNVRFNYADLHIYISDDDGTTTYFRGQVLTFDLKELVEQRLYIGKKQKSILFGDMSNIGSIMKGKDYKEIIPNNKLIDENIIIRSKDHSYMIENANFQQAINKLVGVNQENLNEHILVFDKNKLYVFFYNHENVFEIDVNKREDETKSRESIRADLTKLRQELDNILQYKEQFKIKEDLF